MDSILDGSGAAGLGYAAQGLPIPASRTPIVNPMKKSTSAPLLKPSADPYDLATFLESLFHIGSAIPGSKVNGSCAVDNNETWMKV